MKCKIVKPVSAVTNVTPFAGVWIEIVDVNRKALRISVTPFAGVWIEIFIDIPLTFYYNVTPFAGVWIEMSPAYLSPDTLKGHPLRGGVD